MIGKIKQPKKLTIELEFRTTGELTRAIREIIDQVVEGVDEVQKKSTSYSYEYSLRFLKEFDYKEVLINGDYHMVIPSKMNKNASTDRTRF